MWTFHVLRSSDVSISEVNITNDPLVPNTDGTPGHRQTDRHTDVRTRRHTDTRMHAQTDRQVGRRTDRNAH
jgi:hypothetical protein